MTWIPRIWLSSVRGAVKRAFVFAALTLGACAMHGAPGTEHGKAGRGAPLDDRALRELFFDAYVSLPNAIEIDDSLPLTEIFRANGAYERLEGRTRLEGGFEFQGGAVCVQGAAIPRRCRQVLPQADGSYILVDQSNGSSTNVIITPLLRKER